VGVARPPPNFFFLSRFFCLKKKEKEKNDFLRDIFERIGYIAKLENLVGVHCKFFHFIGKIAIWVKLGGGGAKL
jgi:hypothetical protein